MKQNKLFHISLICLFFLSIWLPILQMKFHLFAQLPDTEKRVLHTMPFFNSDIRRFIKDYENYFNDNFGLRTNFIFYNDIVQVLLFHNSLAGLVVVGKDGWLYLSAGLTDNGKRVPYTSDQLEEIKNFENDEITYLQNNGMYFLSVIAPNKHTIYPEYLPQDMSGIIQSPRLAQREVALSEITNQEINVVPALLFAKKQHLLYFKTDQHWNAYGSFIVYQEIMKNLQKKFPQLQPLTISDFTVVEKKVSTGGDLAYSLGMSQYFSDLDVSFFLKEQSKKMKLSDDKKLNKAVIYYDSFFDPENSWSTSHFLANHFRQVIYVRNNEEFNMSYKYLLKEKPDVVIFEEAERYLEHDVWNTSINNAL